MILIVAYKTVYFLIADAMQLHYCANEASQSHVFMAIKQI
jgi:hypothetical protein